LEVNSLSVDKLLNQYLDFMVLRAGQSYLFDGRMVYFFNFKIIFYLKLNKKQSRLDCFIFLC